MTRTATAPAGLSTDAAPHVVLDVSRLLLSGGKMAPSGIDRVELAYARRWAALPAGRCTFVAGTPTGGWSVLPHPAMVELVHNLSAAWSGQLEGEPGPEAQAARRLANRLRLNSTLALGARALGRVLDRPGPKVFLLVSHRALERQGPIRALRNRGCAFVPLIHDLIPATHPEYARPGQSGRHLRRVATTAALADGVIANSLDTANVLAPHLRARALPPPVLVAPLGIEPPPPIPGRPVQQEPYFVTVGTIEPRKNHLLLLHLWRDLVRVHGAETPRLLIVGRRGWENENIVDILDRSAVLRGTVHELGQLPDRRVADLLRGARALLFPSFVEGYGLPLAEALALGVPAICSDLPALREVGGTVPDYLDPLDGAGWRDLVLDYAQGDSHARAAQISRMAGWRAPGWDDHFRRVDALLARVTGCELSGVAPPGDAAVLQDGIAPAGSVPFHDTVLSDALVTARPTT